VGRKTLIGRLELDITQSSCGENVYTVELHTSSGKKLHNLIEDFLDKKVKITIEEVPIERN